MMTYIMAVCYRRMSIIYQNMVHIITIISILKQREMDQVYASWIIHVVTLDSLHVCLLAASLWDFSSKHP